MGRNVSNLKKDNNQRSNTGKKDDELNQSGEKCKLNLQCIATAYPST